MPARVCWVSGSPAGGTGAGGSGTGVASAADHCRSRTSQVSTRSASAIGTWSNRAAPTLAVSAPSSMVRSRGSCWLKNPLLRSVTWTPATTSTSARSIAALVRGSLAAPL